MISLDGFIEKLLAAAAEAGIAPAEVFCAERSSFSAEAMDGNIDSYEVSETCALSLRGMVDGKTGYASTEAFDDDAVAIRAGHHCAQPLLKHLGLNACCRVSVSVYNTKEEIDRLCESLLKVRKWLGFGA